MAGLVFSKRSRLHNCRKERGRRERGEGMDQSMFLGGEWRESMF